ncbi:YfbR-like 5'-deoxynucleotidase [Labrenzia sp. PHM005]|uniref:YfbR-like 5'-deoxynucleotidase n=1 Tax=Labrenzia sp. PHM005 TaxID=2590016 RepID=UPI001140369F|nr:HD family hydrolase [Labrenzia sp. PHM005]QDG79031.1 HD family hydrolase [Labrenzia sp. PHM005]
MSPSRSDEPPRAWQRMLSGRRLNLLDPSPLDVEISDIAHGLARVARWNGQTYGDHAFSVAEHSLIVEDIALSIKPDLSPDWRLAILLHDAPEYVIGDMISPFKTVIGEAYKGVENRLQGAIHLRFGLPAEMPQTIKKLCKRADIICAFFEAVELAGFDDKEAAKIFGRPRGYPLNEDGLMRYGLTPLPVAKAETLFMERFDAIETLREAGKNTKTRRSGR